MTEQGWMASNDPDVMLDLVRARGLLTDRKARLLGAACCRRVWPLLTSDRSRQAVGATEAFADGLLDQQGRAQAERNGVGAVAFVHDYAKRMAGTAVFLNAAEDQGTHIGFVMGATRDEHPDRPAESVAERAYHAHFLRDLFSPSRSVPLDPSDVTLTVMALALAA